MSNVKSDGEKKVAKWLDSLPIFYEMESVAPEHMVVTKCGIENTINDDVDELLNNILMITYFME